MREYEGESKSARLSARHDTSQTLSSSAASAGVNLCTASYRPGGSLHSHASALRSTAAHPVRAGQLLLGLQRQRGNHYVQRVVSLARQGEGESEVAPWVESTIEQTRGGGQPLDRQVRRTMESAFGADFSGVRIHSGAQAHALNRAVNAVAFTTGQDIFFSDGAYRPGDSAGRELLAHELTHVVQQGGAPATERGQPGAIQRLCPACEKEKGRVRHKLVVGQADDEYEQEADRVAHAVMNDPALASNIGDLQRTYQTVPTQRQCSSTLNSRQGSESRVCQCGRLSKHEADNADAQTPSAKPPFKFENGAVLQRQGGASPAASGGVLASVGGGEWWEWYCALMCAICVGTIIAPELILPEAACAICMDPDLCAKA